MPNKRYRDTFHPEALEELIQTELYYADVSPSLASDFFNEIESALEYLREFADAGQIIHSRNVRKSSLKRFPYNVVYVLENDEIFILAVAHQRSQPLYWFRRLSN